MPKKLTQDEFIQKAITVHGNKYDYSLVDYKGMDTKIKIICPIHGIFEQRPSKHLTSLGCRFCGILFRNKNVMIPQDEFINKAKKVHNNKYDYSLVNYQGVHTKIKIICKKHGVFEQTPSNHLRYQGCPTCKKLLMNDKLSHTTEQFIQLAQKVHKDKYDYSQVTYKNNCTKVKIICPKHGVFEQRPSDHLMGNGCPQCKLSKGEQLISNYLTSHNIDFEVQKRFEDCKDHKPLPFDFYIPSQNICIEYDGIQHFEAIDYFGGQQALESCQKRDQIKTQYCQEHNIKLVRIKWNEENITKILDKITI